MRRSRRQAHVLLHLRRRFPVSAEEKAADHAPQLVRQPHEHRHPSPRPGTGGGLLTVSRVRVPVVEPLLDQQRSSDHAPDPGVEQKVPGRRPAGSGLFDELEHHKLNNIFLTLQGVMEQIILNDGGNDYKLPHMNKAKLARNNELPLTLIASDDVRMKIYDDNAAAEFAVAPVMV